MQHEQGLYNPSFEHDACGIGLVADINGRASHDIVSDGLAVLKKMAHRGAETDDSTGDGAGILVQLPDSFLRKEMKKQNTELPEKGGYGAAMMFLPADAEACRKASEIAETAVTESGGRIIGWRSVPVKPECLGTKANASRPEIRQLFVSFGKNDPEELERLLFTARKRIEKSASENGFSPEELYTVSFSSRTIVYKGMFTADQLESFYPDLLDGSFKSVFAVVHQRYSTNTFPSWILAQPFRMAAHNGEINTIKGNLNRMKAREPKLECGLFESGIESILPVTDPALSDSANFDSVLELLTMSGRSIEHSAMMMIPEAFGQEYHISQDRRAFYEYHSAVMEPWDGPAAIIFTDGTRAGACLDRNGLRPVRWTLTTGGRFVLASESGVLDIPDNEVLKHGRLAPGKMIIADPQQHRLCTDNEIKSSVTRSGPYRKWLEENRIELAELSGSPDEPEGASEPADLVRSQKLFGYTREELSRIIEPMARTGSEPVISMGNDEAPAVLAEGSHLLFDYFRQLFAQVTNPPIDPYRENLVMSLMSFVGREGNLLEETPGHCRMLKLPHPFLSNSDMRRIKNAGNRHIRTGTVEITYGAGSGADGLTAALDKICSETEDLISNGCSIVILSDRNAGSEAVPIPSLLAASCVHHFLVEKRIRQDAAIFIETGEARDVMHMALLLGFGASAINPYLALDTASAAAEASGTRPETAENNYTEACRKGLLKIMSKMGVSTLRSYRGAQLFEAIGLAGDFIGRYFRGTASRIGGIGLKEIEAAASCRHDAAFNRNAAPLPETGGRLHYRKDGEKHLMTPEAVILMQKAARNADYEAYREFSREINRTLKKHCTIRSLLRFRKTDAVPLDEVEPEEEIAKRFVSSAMSLGSISREAHETIAEAMNRLGAMSNSGEGGENPDRYDSVRNGISLNSKVKQIASARFGVTSRYVAMAEELQIKVAQGAKPGEGGQIPGKKVDEFIGSIRYATPGTTLISPPPHHDIYSIEDLAQLIHDLKCANPKARVSVKLVSEAGVGTIAAGVAKGKADMILISGGDGGTGAAPVSSVKYAGMPWELGLAETQQTLLLNGLRGKVRLQADGQMRTGRDIAIAALLGAEEFGFGTASLVTLGCVMMRKCHNNTCPVGVATQDPGLRKRFTGKPEHLMNYMLFVARETREIMAQLGFRSMDQMIGRCDLLEPDEESEVLRQRGIDLTPMLYCPPAAEKTTPYCSEKNRLDLSGHIDKRILTAAGPSLSDPQRKTVFESVIRNTDRSAGAAISCIVSHKYGDKGLPDDTVTCLFRGHAGQSFGAFLAQGLCFRLEGTANDYIGKSMSGGKLIVRPPEGSVFRSQNSIICGNVSLFGATGGEAYISGMAGERFAVRNSGATAVVEGVGDHGCEYMTGGRVVVLGKTGINFAAGMSGGAAYILDENQLFDTRCNLEMVDVVPVNSAEEEGWLKSVIEKHAQLTGSSHASAIIRDWPEMFPAFVKVIPAGDSRHE